MKKKILILIITIIYSTLSFAHDVRLKEIGRIQGVRSNQLIGMGLVVGLNGTGDRSQLAPQMLQNLFQYFGTEIARNQIQSQNVAAVMITADLPSFKRMGDNIDVRVSSVNDANNLEGGILLQTPLAGADGEMYAVAQGSLTRVNNATNNQVNGYIPNGAIVEREVETTIDYSGNVTFVLNQPDFTTASRVATVLNERFGYGTSRAIDPSRVEIERTFSFSNDIVGFISEIENLRVRPDRRSEIVINERTGTVVLGANIMVSPVAITQNNLSISIESQLDLENEFLVEENGEEGPQVQGRQGNSFYFGGTTVMDVIKMLNAVGASSDDVISILQTLKSAGAIDAEIKIM